MRNYDFRSNGWFEGLDVKDGCDYNAAVPISATIVRILGTIVRLRILTANLAFKVHPQVSLSNYQNCCAFCDMMSSVDIWFVVSRSYHWKMAPFEINCSSVLSLRMYESDYDSYVFKLKLRTGSVLHSIQILASFDRINNILWIPYCHCIVKMQLIRKLLVCYCQMKKGQIELVCVVFILGFAWCEYYFCMMC